MSGWVKIHRAIMNNGLWKEKPFSRGQAWIDIILNTSYEPSSFWVRNLEIKLQPGQCAMSQETMANRWGWSRKKVSNFLNKLELARQIEQQKNNTTTLITITNWSTYQEKEQQKEQQRNSKGTPKEHIKEVKEVKKKHYGEFDNVLLSDDEYEKLKNKFNGSCKEKIETLSAYMKSKGKRYKDHYATILNWSRKDSKVEPNTSRGPQL